METLLKSIMAIGISMRPMKMAIGAFGNLNAVRILRLRKACGISIITS